MSRYDDDHEWSIEFRSALSEILETPGSMMQILEKWGNIRRDRVEKEKKENK